MSNELTYRRTDNRHHSTYTVHAGHAHHLGRVHRLTDGGWNGEYDHGGGWQSAGTHATREAAGQALVAAHERRWGPLGERRLTGGSGPTPIAVVSGNDLIRLANDLRRARTERPSVRFTVAPDGLKWDAGQGWTPSLGRLADESGH